MAYSKSFGRTGQPRRDFPLFKHATGRWCKKVRGRFHYFGRVESDPNGEAALKLWLSQRDDLLAGRSPRAASDGLTVREMCNRFLTAKAGQRDAGDIRPTTWDEYYRNCQMVIDVFGKNRLVEDLVSSDFEALRAAMAKRYGVSRLASEVQRARVLFKYAYESGLLDKPMRYGPTFKRPPKRVLRAHKQAMGPNFLPREAILALLEASSPPLRAMIHLGINCGFGNTDCATLPTAAVDLTRGWVTYPRPKTAIERECPLWPETVNTLQEWLTIRPKAKDEAHQQLMFITKYGQPWVNLLTTDNAVTKEFSKLLKQLDLAQPRIGFYTLRHTFATVARRSRDQVAIDRIMGHADPSMAAVYREWVEEDHLRIVVNLVRDWLFGTTETVEA